jgi:hypothetical protein
MRDAGGGRLQRGWFNLRLYFVHVHVKLYDSRDAALVA